MARHQAGRASHPLVPDPIAQVRWAERQLALSDLPVGAIATACGIGQDRLRRLFVQRHGLSPAAYRAGCRLASG